MARPHKKEHPDRWAYVLLEKAEVVGCAMSQRLAYAWKRVDWKHREFMKVPLIRISRYPQFKHNPEEGKRETHLNVTGKTK